MAEARTQRVEMDVLWAFVGKEQARVNKIELAAAIRAALGDSAALQ